MFKTRDWIKRIIGVVKERVLLSVDRQAGLDCTRTALLEGGGSYSGVGGLRYESHPQHHPPGSSQQANTAQSALD